MFEKCLHFHEKHCLNEILNLENRIRGNTNIIPYSVLFFCTYPGLEITQIKFQTFP